MDLTNPPGKPHFPSWRLNILASWLALGLVIQTSFVLLPIGNYATLVYWLFYAPLLILLGWQYSSFAYMIKRIDRTLIVAFSSLLLWVAITSLWSGTEESLADTLLEAAQRIFLILMYAVGIAYLACHFPGILKTGLIASAIIVALTALASVIDQFILNDASLSRRLSRIGFGDWRNRSNAVVTGIYFGVYAIIPSALLMGRSDRNYLSTGLLALCAIACLIAATLTGTRTAVIAIIATVLVYLAVQRRLLILAAIGVISAVAVVHGLVDESAQLHKYLTRGGLGSWRPEIWLASLQASGEHFWVGSGMWHNFQLIATRGEATSSQPHSHNFYLQLLNWAGIIGLGLYVTMLGRALVLGYRYRHQPFAMLGLMTMTYFIVVQVFDVYDVFTKPSYYWPCLWLPLGVLAGLSARHASQRPTAIGGRVGPEHGLTRQEINCASTAKSAS